MDRRGPNRQTDQELMSRYWREVLPLGFFINQGAAETGMLITSGNTHHFGVGSGANINVFFRIKIHSEDKKITWEIYYCFSGMRRGLLS